MENRSAANQELRVIVIDDDPFDAELIEMTLKANMACHVVTVGARPAFLLELEHALPDIIISDSNIPSFDGLAALALAKHRCPEVPFVFCSGAVSEDVKATALALGAKAWLSKDNLDRLALVVRKLCGGDPAIGG